MIKKTASVAKTKTQKASSAKAVPKTVKVVKVVKTKKVVKAKVAKSAKAKVAAPAPELLEIKAAIAQNVKESIKLAPPVKVERKPMPTKKYAIYVHSPMRSGWEKRKVFAPSVHGTFDSPEAARAFGNRVIHPETEFVVDRAESEFVG